MRIMAAFIEFIRLVIKHALQLMLLSKARVGDVARELPSTNQRRSTKRKGGGWLQGWQGVADCVPCGRLECAMLGMGRGARLACARAAQRRRCDFSVIR